MGPANSVGIEFTTAGEWSALYRDGAGALVRGMGANSTGQWSNHWNGEVAGKPFPEDVVNIDDGSGFGFWAAFEDGPAKLILSDFRFFSPATPLGMPAYYVYAGI
jgi:hypothetical protein